MPLLPLMTNSANVAIPAMDTGLSMHVGDVFIARYVDLPALGIGIAAAADSVEQIVGFPEMGMGVGIATPVPVSVLVAAPSFGLGAAMDPGQAAAFDTGSAVIRYFCTLTGDADGVSDLTLPIKSFQARRRSGSPTYLTVVVPTVDYANEIAARPNGSLKIQQAYEQNGTIRQIETIMETDLEAVRPDEGGTNVSTTLTGYSTSSFAAKAVSLRGVTYRTMTNGKHRYRLARPYVFLNPGDTVTILDDGVVFEVAVMSYYIDAVNSTIELEST